HSSSCIVSALAKSRNPCYKLTASNSCASRVISLITDSVNCVAFFDPLGFNMYETLSFTTEDTEDIQRGILSFRKELSRVLFVLPPCPLWFRGHKGEILSWTVE